MVEQHRPDRRETPQVVFAGGKIAVPGDHVERRLAELGDIELAQRLYEKLAWLFLVFERGDWCQKIPRIGQAIGADRAALRQRQIGAVVLADVTSRRPVGQIDFELHALRYAVSYTH